MGEFQETVDQEKGRTEMGCSSCNGGGDHLHREGKILFGCCLTCGSRVAGGGVPPESGAAGGGGAFSGEEIGNSNDDRNVPLNDVEPPRQSYDGVNIFVQRAKGVDRLYDADTLNRKFDAITKANVAMAKTMGDKPGKNPLDLLASMKNGFPYQLLNSEDFLNPRKLADRKKGSNRRNSNTEGVQGNKGSWSVEEQMQFLEAVNKHGMGSWKAIANEIPTRNTNQVVSHAQKHMIYQAKRKNMNPEELKRKKPSIFDCGQDQ